MKNVKIITVAILVLFAAAVLVSSVAAMPVGYSANNAYGGRMGGYGYGGGYGGHASGGMFGEFFAFGHGMMNWFGNSFNHMMRWLKL